MLPGMRALALLLIGASLIAPGRAQAVGTVEYHLGDQAFTVPRTGGARAELTGIVHYPLDAGKHPVVMILHGLWESCADRTAWAAEQKAEKAGDEVAVESSSASSTSGRAVPEPARCRATAASTTSATRRLGRALS